MKKKKKKKETAGLCEVCEHVSRVIQEDCYTTNTWESSGTWHYSQVLKLRPASQTCVGSLHLRKWLRPFPKMMRNLWLFDSPLSVCWPEWLHLQRESSGFYLPETEQHTKRSAEFNRLTFHWLHVSMISGSDEDFQERFFKSINGTWAAKKTQRLTHVLCCSRDDVKPVVGGFDVNPLKDKTELKHGSSA